MTEIAPHGHKHSTIDRSLSSLRLASGPAWATTVSTSYRAPIELVWAALTTAERIPRWFLPITGSLTLGGRYQLDGNAGGEILACEQPHRFAVSWEFESDVSWLDVRLLREPTGDTRVTLEHVAHVSLDRWEEFGPGATGIGWDLSLHGLDHYLLSLGGGSQSNIGDVVGPEWLESRDGLRFMTASSLAWAEANIAAGTDPRLAHAAEARVRAAYTGSPDSAVPGDVLPDLSTVPLLATTLISPAVPVTPPGGAGHDTRFSPDAPNAGWLLGIEIALEVDRRELWSWITDPELLARWSPAVPDRVLDSRGPATVTETSGDDPVDAEVLMVDSTSELIHRWGESTLRWILAESGPGEGGGTVLRLEHRLDRRDTAPMAAAGWHICFAVLHACTAGRPVPRVVGQTALDHGWAQLNTRYLRELLR